MLALRVRCAGETDSLVDVLSCSDGCGLDASGTGLANLFIELETTLYIVGITVLLAENDVQGRGILNSLDSSPTSKQRRQQEYLVAVVKGDTDWLWLGNIGCAASPLRVVTPFDQYG